ncbi:MAG TPA: general stress protein [Aeromicrobium sp.]|nr:general stress protein [Aeromicrobium sp.]
MAEIFSLKYPQSLGVYDDYAGAQKAVDFLSDEGFPVQNVLIVGTDLKQVERVTGRLTTPRVLAAGAASGAWLGLLVGLLLGIFTKGGAYFATVLTGVVLGIIFGAVWALIGYLATRGQRDFSSITKVVPGRYEVLTEHNLLAQGQELLARLPVNPAEL